MSNLTIQINNNKQRASFRLFIEQVNNFFFHNQKIEITVYTIAILTSLIYAVTNRLLFQRLEKAVLYEGCLLAASILFTGVVGYGIVKMRLIVKLQQSIHSQQTSMSVQPATLKESEKKRTANSEDQLHPLATAKISFFHTFAVILILSCTWGIRITLGFLLGRDAKLFGLIPMSWIIDLANILIIVNYVWELMRDAILDRSKILRAKKRDYLRQFQDSLVSYLRTGWLVGCATIFYIVYVGFRSGETIPQVVSVSITSLLVFILILALFVPHVNKIIFGTLRNRFNEIISDPEVGTMTKKQNNHRKGSP